MKYLERFVFDLRMSKSTIESSFYSVSENYWRGQPATENGMLGGYGFVSDRDIETSQKFIDSYFKVILIS